MRHELCSATLHTFLTELASRMANIAERGQAAGYISELSRINLQQFGMSLCLSDGTCLSVGDANTQFSIQSISKVFTLAIALGRFGDHLWTRVGRDPSNYAFKSVSELESQNGKPRNPFVNAGALVISDAILKGNTPKTTLAEILTFMRAAAESNEIYINRTVAHAENKTGHRNYALAHFLRSCGNLDNSCEMVLGTYFHHCAIEMSCNQLASAGRFLAGIQSFPRLIGSQHVRSINALMMIAGHYDGSGDFAYFVGFPGKSGVGGGILAIVPGVASIAVWSPGLNRYGNSLLGTRALEELAHFTRWSLFESPEN